MGVNLQRPFLRSLVTQYCGIRIYRRPLNSYRLRAEVGLNLLSLPKRIKAQP